MAQVCNVCTHINRIEIDRRIVSGGNLSEISREYGISYGSLSNHASNHITRQLATAMAKKEMTESWDLISKIENILFKAEKIFSRNFDKGKDGLALKALSEQRSTIELFAKIAAYLHEFRAAELQSKRQQDDEIRSTEDEAIAHAGLSRLNDAELNMYERLMAKMMGDTDETIIKEHDWDISINPKPDIPQTEIVDSELENPCPAYENEPEPTLSVRRTKQPRNTVQPMPSVRLEPYREFPHGPGGF